MAGKHDTAETSWRPIAQKLSGLIIRNGPGKAKKSPVATDEKSSVFRFKGRNLKKGPFADNARDFKPLDVDVDILEAFRLTEGWLETNARDTDQGRKPQQQQQQQQPRRPPPPDNRTTPIAHQFAGTSVLNLQSSDQHVRSNSQIHDGNHRRPFSMIENQAVTYTRISSDNASVRNVQATGSILDRGRPIEARHFVTEPLKKTKSLRQEQPPPQSSTTVLGKAGTLKETPSKPVHYGGVSSDFVAKKQNVYSQLRPTGNLDTTNRHSMYAGVTPTLNSVAARTRISQAPRSVSATPLDRIQAWQKSVTSAPTSAASASALGQGVPSQVNGPARKVSTRGVTGNRLAWIRELEERKSSNVNRDVGILKKQLGSVSDKLAMFESKQAPPASTVSRLPPLTRSNSTTSRLSSVGLESTSAYGNITATPRTSIDTAPSSHRASSVMSYYDDSFREKMETLVSGYSADKDKPDTKKQRVSVQFVPVTSRKGEEEPQPLQPESAVVDAKSETQKREEAPASLQVEADTSNAALETEKIEEPESSQAEAESSNAALMTEKAEDEPEPSHIEAETLNATTETEKAEDPGSSHVEAETSNATLETEQTAMEPESSQVEEETPVGTLETEKAEDYPESSQSELGTSSAQKEEEMAEEIPESSQAEAETSNATLETEQVEEEPKSSQVEAETSNVVLETEKAEEDPESPQTEAEMSTITLETEKLEQELESSLIEPETSNIMSETEEAKEEPESRQVETDISSVTLDTEEAEEEPETCPVEKENLNTHEEKKEEQLESCLPEPGTSTTQEE